MTTRYRVMNEDLRPSYLGFHDLMSWRVERILLVASLYDAFVLEEDGRLTERIFSEYSGLSLHSPPRVTPVRSVAKALKALEKGSFDLVVTTLRLPDQDTADFVLEVKRRHPDMPVILLAWDTKMLKRRQDAVRRAGLDRSFLWTGDTSIFLALVKSVEDQANLDIDVSKGDVRLVVVVEDSVRYYSSLLPILYREIMLQTQALIDEGINDFHRIFRMRARPKLLLANTFEEALEVFERYPENVLGFLSDIRFPRNGEEDPEAGFELVRTVRKRATDVPFLLLSAEAKNAGQAYVLGTSFLDKNAPDLVQKVRRFIKLHLGFGDFIFRTPDGLEEGRAKNIRELLELLAKASDEAVAYHARRNHFSHWLSARGEFALARQLRPHHLDTFNAVSELRDDLIRRIRRSQETQARGVIADLSAGDQYYPTRTFSRLGSGSLGGKSRSVAFLGALLERANLEEAFPNIKFGVPRTVALGAYVFEQFVERNDLEWLAGANLPDEKVAEEFLRATLPDEIRQNLSRVLEVVTHPLAIRSSSLLEDSPDQPFAGVFQTHMIPNAHSSLHVRLHHLCRAIKLVYASIWFKAARGYLKVTGHNPLDQKMGVAIQQLVGRRYGDVFYPCVSGVAQTHNFYPVRYQKPSDGVAVVALGLGRTITEGANALRFSPRHPEVIPQLALSQVLDSTQREFWALDLSRPDAELQLSGDEFPLVRLGLSAAEAHGTLQNLGSVLCPQDDRIRDGLSAKGPRVVTFAPLLKWKLFPLADILDTVLQRAHNAMAGPAEIEFSAVVRGDQPEFQLLQIRPLTVFEMTESVDLDVREEELLLKSVRTLGHGNLDGIQDVVYVKPQPFDRTQTKLIVPEVDRCNETLLDAGRPYLLIGPGRWGTSDPMVGIPVRWDQVSGARVIVESDLPGFEVEPSQGNHFFHNLTAHGVFIFTVSFRNERERLDWSWLDEQPAEWEGDFVRHLRLPQPLRMRLDGQRGHGVVLKPQGAPAVAP